MTEHEPVDDLGRLPGHQNEASLHGGLVMFLEYSAKAQVAAGVRDAPDYHEALRLVKSLRSRLKRAECAGDERRNKAEHLAELTKRLAAALDAMRTVMPRYERLPADQPVPTDTVVVEIDEVGSPRGAAADAKVLVGGGLPRSSINGSYSPKTALARAEELRHRHRLKRVMVRISDTDGWRADWGNLAK